jgi:hypothetical protein
MKFAEKTSLRQVPGPPHVLQGKPQVSTAFKVKRSDIRQPVHHPGSRFRSKQ